MKFIFVVLLVLANLNASCDFSVKIIKECDVSVKDLTQYDFSDKTIENVNFNNANLFGAIFGKAKLTNVTFKNANLFGSYFVEATLDNVSFNQADISSADFTGVTLNNTNFKTAIQEDTTFGKMNIEQPKIIKYKSCKMIIPIKHKSAWDTATLGILLDAGHSEEFIVRNLCDWQKNATFKLHNYVKISKKKRKFTLIYKSCKFPVYVSSNDKRIQIESTYRKSCLKATPSQFNRYCETLSYSGSNLDMYMCKGGKYCDYLSNNRDIYMCKRGKYCDYLSNNRDIYMCKGGKYCDYLSNTRDINMCKGMSR